MKIVVDTNIVFSALLNTNNTLGEILINSGATFEFYSCNYMRYEINKHWERLKKISKLPDKQLDEIRFYLYSKLKFVDEDLIPRVIWEQAFQFTNNIDVDDTDFLALTIYLDAFLWTGDKVLYNGLKEKQFEKVFNTSDIRNYIR